MELEGTNRHLTNGVRIRKKYAIPKNKGRKSSLSRAVSSGLCNEVTFQLRFPRFPESDEEKSWEGFYRQRGQHVKGLEVERVLQVYT